MLKDILREHDANIPDICNDFKDLHDKLTKIQVYSKKGRVRFCLMIHEVKLPEGKFRFTHTYIQYLVYVPVFDDGTIDNSQAVGFEIPCPPYCDVFDLQVAFEN